MSRGRLSAALSLTAAAAVLVSAAPAHADPEVKSVTIVPAGAPVVGVPLTAVAVIEDGPATIRYAWRRCRTARPADCEALVAGATYTPVAADVDRWLQARAQPTGADDRDWSKWSAAVGPVRPAPVLPPAQPSPSPSPQPSPSPSPQLQSQSSFPPDVPPPAASAPPLAAAPELSLAPRYLQPFPTVRIRGSIAARGANVDLLRVTAPSDATVKVRCAGFRCPVKRQTRRPGRIRKLERFLPAGLRITIRVRRQAYVGKYVRLKVRAGLPPARTDACVMPGSAAPVACPQ